LEAEVAEGESGSKEFGVRDESRPMLLQPYSGCFILLYYDASVCCGSFKALWRWSSISSMGGNFFLEAMADGDGLWRNQPQ
jgi:hypothetical protein